jgi:TPR repeat protein
LKLAAHQGIGAAQFNDGICLRNGECVSIDFEGAEHYFKLAADHGVAEAQYGSQSFSSTAMPSIEILPIPFEI